MALPTPDLSASIATSRDTFVVSDDSVYSSPARSTLRIFLSAYKVDVDNNATALTVTSDTGDPQTSSSYTCQYTVDGFYRVYFVVIQAAYSAGTSYAQYDAVYDGSNNVYRSKSAGNIGNALNNTTYWELISDPSSLAANKDTATESLNISSDQYLRVFSADGQYAFANQLSDQCGCSDCEDIAALQNYMLFAMLLDSMSVADSRSEVIDGEAIARRISANFLTNC
jgi:hypothetical protein